MDAKVTLVVGGSVSGLQSALQQAEAGNKVYLLESCPGLEEGKIMSENTFDPEHPFSHIDLKKMKENRKHKTWIECYWFWVHQ